MPGDFLFVFPAEFGAEREGGQFDAALHGADLGVLAEVAYKDDLVDGFCHWDSSLFGPGEAVFDQFEVEKSVVDGHIGNSALVQFGDGF